MKEIVEKYCSVSDFVGEYHFKCYIVKVGYEGVYIFYENNILHKFIGIKKLEMFFKSLE